MLFCWLYIVSPCLAANESIWFQYEHLVMSLCRVFSGVPWSECFLWAVCSLGKTLFLFSGFILSSKAKLRVTPGVSWLPILNSIPLWWKGHILCMYVLEVLVGLHRRSYYFIFFSITITNSGIKLDDCNIACFGNEQGSFCHFWDCLQVLHFRLFVDYGPYSIYSKSFMPTVVDIMVIWVKFTHSSPF